MISYPKQHYLCLLYLALLLPLNALRSHLHATEIGKEISILRHLQDGEEYKIPLKDLIAHGEKLFAANWTVQEGAGRPFTKGTGARLTDPKQPLR
ncbi:MAG: hypothetical protein ACRD4B_10455, partial [Acidobacteriota bacterium]